MSSPPPAAPPASGAASTNVAGHAKRSALIGAAFLMATSAIGPGFLTQTAHFTDRLAASFGFAILMSILIDLVAQLNIWRVLVAAGRRAEVVGNEIAPGLGHLLTILVAAGGLAFNIGNVAGAGLGLNAALGVPVATGAAVSAALAVGIFLVREAGRAMDLFAQTLGFVMVGLTVYVAVSSSPPYGEAVARTFVPEQIDLLAIVTIVGGTVGGYITFAGAHRLLDAGVRGPGSVVEASRAATRGILVASTMRIVLFLAALGVVAQGVPLDPQNPAATVFEQAAGGVGRRIFGVVMWAAAITSVVGAAYTSVSFLRSWSALIDRHWPRVIIAFIVVSTAVFLAVGRPRAILVLVGALNGLILPISLGSMLAAAHKRKIVGDYRHPVWLTAAGVVVALAMAAMGAYVLTQELGKL